MFQYIYAQIISDNNGERIGFFSIKYPKNHKTRRSHLLWHNFVKVRDNWIKLSVLVGGSVISPPGKSSSQRQAYVLLVFFYLFYILYFNDFCPTNYLNTYKTDLRQLFPVV